MRLPLDTPMLLWVAGQSARLPHAARMLLEDPDHQLVFSAASIREIAIKRSLGREGLTPEAGPLRRGLLDNGYEELPIIGAHAIAIQRLPPLHKDPFDRILVARSQVEGITLLTADSRVAAYPGAIRHLG